MIISNIFILSKIFVEIKISFTLIQKKFTHKKIKRKAKIPPIILVTKGKSTEKGSISSNILTAEETLHLSKKSIPLFKHIPIDDRKEMTLINTDEFFNICQR